MTGFRTPFVFTWAVGTLIVLTAPRLLVARRLRMPAWKTVLKSMDQAASDLRV